jgi:hypothetical protein
MTMIGTAAAVKIAVMPTMPKKPDTVASVTAVTSASVPTVGDVRVAGMISGCDRQCPASSEPSLNGATCDTLPLRERAIERLNCTFSFGGQSRADAFTSVGSSMGEGRGEKNRCPSIRPICPHLRLLRSRRQWLPMHCAAMAGIALVLRSPFCDGNARCRNCGRSYQARPWCSAPRRLCRRSPDPARNVDQVGTAPVGGDRRGDVADHVSIRASKPLPLLAGPRECSTSGCCSRPSSLTLHPTKGLPTLVQRQRW